MSRGLYVFAMASRAGSFVSPQDRDAGPGHAEFPIRQPEQGGKG